VFKQVAAILLLGTMLFNWYGYKLFIALMDHQEASKLEARIDANNYNESSLISIKIPVTSLPYYNNSKSFERTDGRIEIAGIEYNYVKRRIYNDSLEVLILPNKAAMQLHSAKEAYFKLVNDLQFGQNKKPNSHNDKNKGFSFEKYTVNDLDGLSLACPAISKHHLPYLDNISSDFSSTDEYPPDSAV
jgi:hypothetical protein